MNFKRKLALFLCGAMLAQPVWVNAEGEYEQGADAATSSAALFVRDVPGTDGIRLVENADTDWTESGNMLTGSYYLEDKNGKRLTEEYMYIEPISGKAGLYRYGVPAGHQSNWCGIFRLKDGQVNILVEAGPYIYLGIDCGEASFYFYQGTSGEYYDVNGNKIKDLGAYLKPYGISLARDKWAEEAIIDGTDCNYVPRNLLYNYRNNITRREYCHLAVAVYEGKKGNYRGKAFTRDAKSPFTDVDDCYVSAAAELGIVSGMGNGKFEPDRPITRQEAAVLLCGLAKALERDTQVEKVKNFADDAAIADWAKPSVYKICGIKSESGNGVMVGVGNNKFSPATYYTREQAIVTAYRLFREFSDYSEYLE